MSTAEYPDHMSDVVPTDTEEQIEALAELHKKADKIHRGEMGEIERFKSIMDKLHAIEADIVLIKKHFNIVPILNK